MIVFSIFIFFLFFSNDSLGKMDAFIKTRHLKELQEILHKLKMSRTPKLDQALYFCTMRLDFNFCLYIEVVTHADSLK